MMELQVIIIINLGSLIFIKNIFFLIKRLFIRIELNLWQKAERI